MRIISQDGNKDFPYKRCTIWVFGQEIMAAPVGGPEEVEATMAKYSTPEKVQKAIQRLHDCYQCGLKNVVFRFPQEDDL